MKRFLFAAFLILTLAGYAGADTTVYGGSTSRISRTILVPTASDDYPVEYIHQSSTLDSLKVVCAGGTSATFTLQVCDSDSTSNCAALTSELTVTSGTLGTATISNSVIGADKWLKMLVGTVTGVVTQCTYTIRIRP
jgi:hypothetical protein